MIKVIYKDISPLAKGDSTPMSTDKQSFVNMNDLKSEELTPFGNHALCLPRYSKLDGRYVNAPNTMPTSGEGYVSTSISKSDRTFANNPVIEINFSQNHSAIGITLAFNEYSNDYADLLNIKWYRDTTLLSDKDFEPTGASYSCMNTVELFNRLIIEFKRTSKPNRYIFVSGIKYGIEREYAGQELTRVNLLSELSQISEELTINTLEFSIIAKEDAEYLFQKQQKMLVYNGETLLGSYFLDTATRKSERMYDISCYDGIGILDQTNFMGGIYSGVTAGSLIASIFEGTNLEYTVDSITRAKQIYGYMPILTKREALCWVCMATSSVADTTKSERVDIYRLSDTVHHTITEDQEYSGVTIENTQIVTGIKLTSYRYVMGTESTELYNDTLNGTITVEFGSPLHSLAITGGTIVESGVNYAIISGTGGTVVLTGKEYNIYTKVVEKNNPLIGALDIKNIIEVSDCTIISSNNADEVASNILNYYLKTKKVNAKIKLEEEDLGQKVTINAKFEGDLTGTIEKLEISGNNKVAGKVVIR